MKKILHHLRRKRSYSHHERWGVLVAMFALTVLVSAGGWLLFGLPVASATSLEVQSIDVTQNVVPADGTVHSQATLTIVDIATKEPAADIWVGLNIIDPDARTPELTYFDWYSFEPARSFYQTDLNGQIKFEMASALPGRIEYQVYVANPELKNDNKYQALTTSFWITYQ